MQLMEDSVKDSLSSIPDLFYDLIGRLIPGSLFLALVFWPWLSKELNIQTISLAIIISYFLGLFFSVIGNNLWGSLLFNHKTRIKKFMRGNPCHKDQEIWDISRGTINILDRRLITKMMAEKTMFSSLTLICLIAAVFPPTEFFIQNTFLVRLFFLVSFFLMVFCMITVHKWISLYLRKF